MVLENMVMIICIMHEVNHILHDLRWRLKCSGIWWLIIRYQYFGAACCFQLKGSSRIRTCIEEIVALHRERIG